MRGLIRIAAVVSVAAATFSYTGLAGATVHPAPALARSERLVYRGTVNLAAIAARQGTGGRVHEGRRPARPASPVRPKPATRAAVPAPNPPATPIMPKTGRARGFAGLTGADSGFINNGYDAEPPDQGLCAYNGVVLEEVNLAVRAYTQNGVALTPTVSLNSFFGLAPAENSAYNRPTFGPFLSDPRCYYDAQTRRWFVTAEEIDINPYTGAFGYRSSQLIAVSQTSDPTGNYGRFSFGTTNDGLGGTPSEPNCPCEGDQPRIGADAHGFYISTDSYPIHGLFNSNGGELYAMSKQGLAAAANGARVPTLVAIHVGAVIIGGFPANAVQPAETPEGGGYAPNREYFLSTPDYNGFATKGGAGARAVVLWTLSGTSSLARRSPSVTLRHAIIPSERYAPPVPAVQKPGPRSLGRSLGAPLPPVDSGIDKMMQVEYLNGRLFSSLTTGVGLRGKAIKSGVAWFVVTPHGSTGTVSRQGYLAASDTTTLMYPSIGLNQFGRGVMTFSVSGRKYYPSAAYILFSRFGPVGPIFLIGPGSAPEDGYTCYKKFGGGPTCRWGDYTAASSDGTGRVVIGAEMIPNTARDQFANWGTFLSTLKR